ncbi:thioredoxin family protein [Paenibacillus sp. YPG26]|uniref:thioredoxin family protein n=1 Tax=Paenibacillus sp. YPG26 TaxID=2878915 RepID=UPI00203F27B3|nr:thioredoxin family protein [Paenibacillus sp. YPG26]USB32690.1 thioredoxin family protein [Paenibacillus sp. YPG26]
MKEIHPLTSLDSVGAFLEQHKLSFLYVSRPECNVCHSILPKLRELLEHYPKIHLGHIDASQVEEIAAKYLIFTVPAMLLVIDKKEYIRSDRFVRFENLNQEIEQIYELVTQDDPAE